MIFSTDKYFSARTIAADVIYAVTEQNAYANLTLDKYMKQKLGKSLKFEDVNLLTELANGTIKMIKHLDWVLNLFLKKNITKMNPEVRAILRMSAYQLLFLDRIPAYAVVDEAVKIVKNQKGKVLAGVVNGVLRAIIRSEKNWSYPSKTEQPVEFLATFYSQPEWLVEALLEQLGFSDTEAVLAFYNQSPQVFIRTNFSQISRPELQQQLAEEGVETSLHAVPETLEVLHSKKSLFKTRAWKQGYFYVQNPASTLAAHILNPQPQDEIYDLCCGIGGKVLHLAEYTKGQARLTANDIYEHKLTLLQKNQERLQLGNIELSTQNLLELEFQDKQADKILLDVPCSGWGVLQRRSDLRWTLSPQNIIEMIALQEKMLAQTANMVKSGGTLLYATCTFNQNENQKMIDHFLNKHPNFELQGFAELVDFIPWQADELESIKKGSLTLLPGKYNTDGMFYAKLRRKD